jgi:hypothetical protein
MNVSAMTLYMSQDPYLNIGANPNSMTITYFIGGLTDLYKLTGPGLIFLLSQANKGYSEREINMADQAGFDF